MTDTPPPAAPSPRLRVAALDDDADFREFLAGVLASEGHEASLFAEASDLLAACERSLPDVVLLDMKMGESRGEDVLADLRRRWPRLCVIVVTGFPSLDSMRLTFRQDAFDYLAKPFSTEDLRRALAQAAAAFDLGRSPHERLRTELGRRIRLCRAERGWTLRDLSEASGLSVSLLSTVERGAAMPSLESLLDIARALDERASVWLDAAGF